MLAQAAILLTALLLLASARAHHPACKLEPNPGLCLGAFPKYFFDEKDMKCKVFIYGGCGGVVPFNTIADCQRKCEGVDPCTLKPDVGPCDAAIPKYFYNFRTRMCETFTWGGCAGTVPFDTLFDCEASKCRCTQKTDPGPCRARFIRWFFDNRKQMCKSFIYGGCRGSVPFDTEKECEDENCPAKW